MSALAFDTHKALKALKEAGFDDAQAEAVVGTVGDAVGGNVAKRSNCGSLSDLKPFTSTCGSWLSVSSGSRSPC